MKRQIYFSGQTNLLSKRSEAQLMRAFDARMEERNGLWTHYLKPHLVDVDRGTYVPLLPRPNYPGYRQDHIECLIRESASDEEILARSPRFCMPLREASYGRQFGDGGKAAWERPSDRLVNAGFWVFTMEVDAEELADLEEQLSWCRSRGKKPSDSPIGDVDKALRRLRDYRGVTAVYSGNKSVHFHFVFDTCHISSELSKNKSASKKWLGDVPDVCLKDLYRQCWGEIANIFTENLSTHLTVDGALASVFQQRRTPWGHRIVEPGHFLGLEPGTIVRQAVLIDLVQQRTPRGSTIWLIHPDKTTAIADLAADAPRRSYGLPIEQSMADDVLAELSARLKAEWGTEYPKPVQISSQGGENVVHFKNHAGDRNPSTIIRGTYRKLLVCGANAPAEALRMPDGWTLDDVLDDIRGIEAAGRANAESRTSRPFWERRFAARAISKIDARKALGGSTNLVTGAGSFAWIKSIEGIGKTWSLIYSAPYRRLDQYLDRHWGKVTTEEESGSIQEPGFLAFACRSYEQAAEKCQEFNQVHRKEGRFFGRVLPSFSRVYQEAYRQVGATALSYADVGMLGYSSYLEAIQGEQPGVYKEMCRLRTDLWTNPWNPEKPFPGRLQVVWFTVHSLIQHWGVGSTSRVWLHPAFDEAQGNQEKLAACRDNLWISEVVYDEVGVDDLVDIVEEPVVRWCENIKRTQKHWNDLGLPEQYQAYANAKAPSPSTGGKELSFEDFHRIIGIGFTQSDLKVVDTSISPFGNDHSMDGIYLSQDGKKFCLKPRRWWRTLGAKVTVLTTEELPTRVAEKLRWPGGPDDEGKPRSSRFRIYRFDSSENFMNELVDLHLDSRAAKDQQEQAKISALIEEFQTKHPEAKVITNNAGGFENAISHPGAKGSNNLRDRDLFTILQYLSPSKYAQLCLLASEFEMPDVIQLHYRDELFQAIGRNRGMRRDQSAPKSHSVIMSPRLYKELGKGALTADCRYELVCRKDGL